MKKYILVMALAVVTLASFSHDGKTDKTKKVKAELHKSKHGKSCSGHAAANGAAPACCQKGGAKSCHGTATAAPAATPTAPIPAGK